MIVCLRNLGVLVILFCLLALLLAPADWNSVAILVLQCILPGLAWGLALCTPGDERSEQVLMGFGVSFVVSGLTVLVMHYWPGPLPRAAVLVAQVLLFLVPAVIVLKRRCLPLANRPHSWAVLVVLALAICLRLARLAYAELDGDEALILLRAAQAIGGREDVLFWHKKGPAEILLSILTWQARGSFNEVGGRLPFALAGIMGLVGIYLLGRRLIGRQSALLAVALLAVNGYLVAYARIIQYQSLVFSMATLALLSLERDRLRDIFLAGLFIGFGVLAHWDALLTMPAVVYWLVNKTRASSHTPAWLVPLVAASGFLIVVVPFYLPFVLSSGFSVAWSYLTKARIGTGSLYNNLGSFIQVDAFYNSVYYLLIIATLLFIAALREWRRWSTKVYPVIVIILIAAAAIWVWPDSWVLARVNLSLLPFSLLLIMALCAPGNPPHRRVIWLWLAPSFVFYLFLVKDPRTHVYTLFPAWALLAADAATASWAWQRKRSTALGPFILAALAIVFVLATGYIHVAFIRTTPEYLGAYPTSRSLLYWTFSKDVPPNVYFGFPHRAGWKVIGHLYSTGELDGVYASNEIPRITNWYTRYAPRTSCPTPDYYFIAEDIQEHIHDHVPVALESVSDEYGLIGIVTKGGRPGLRLYQRGATSSEPVTYQVENFDVSFDASAKPEVWASGFQPSAFSPTDVRLGETIRLIGYALTPRQVRPGGSTRLVLYWEADQRIEENYVVFVHLIRSGVQWGTGDGIPDCAVRPTPLWLPEEVILDLHNIAVYPDAPTGAMDLFIGMYDLFTGERAPVYLGGERVPGDTLYLTSVEILPAAR